MRRIGGVIAAILIAGVIGAIPATAADAVHGGKASVNKAGKGKKAAQNKAKAKAKQAKKKAKATAKKKAKAKKKARKLKPVIPSTRTIFQYIKDLTSFGYRRTGTKASKNAAKYVRGKFKRFGLKRIGYQTVRSYDWRVKNSSLTVGGVKQDSFPIAHAFMGGTQTGKFGTGNQGVSAPVVDVGAGGEADFSANDVNGKVVLFDLRFTGLSGDVFKALANFYHDPNNTFAAGEVLPQPYLTNFVSVMQRAIDNGAVGAIGVLADYFDSKYYFNEEYRALQMNIPGMWVTRNRGAAIRAQLAANPGVQAKLVMGGERKAAPARNVIGYLPGKSKQTMLISTHHDSVWKGAVQDGSGVAEVLALARYFGALPRKKRPMTLMFATMDSHFSGYQAHQAFVRKYVTGVRRAKRPKLHFAVEHISRHGKVVDGRLQMTNLPEPKGILQNVGPKPLEVIKKAVVRNGLDRTFVLPAGVFGGSDLPTDASFTFAAGVPVVSLIGGPIYLYDKADDLDKVYKPHLRPVALAYKQMIEGMSRMALGDLPGIPPVTPGG